MTGPIQKGRKTEQSHKTQTRRQNLKPSIRNKALTLMSFQSQSHKATLITRARAVTQKSPFCSHLYNSVGISREFVKGYQGTLTCEKIKVMN